MRYFIFTILLVVPLLLTAQSKKEQIATLNLRVDSLSDVLVNVRLNNEKTLTNKKNYIYRLSQEKEALEKELAEVKKKNLDIKNEKVELIASFNSLTENVFDLEKLILVLEDSLLNRNDSIILLREEHKNMYKLNNINKLNEIIEYRGGVIDDLLYNSQSESNNANNNWPETDSLRLLTSISINEYSYDFGRIVEGDTKAHYFSVTNTGNNPLIFEMCKGSCGCTVPTCPNKPISPGETGYIKVDFNSKGKKNKMTKKITVTANTDPAQTILTIQANVTPSPLIEESCSQ